MALARRVFLPLCALWVTLFPVAALAQSCDVVPDLPFLHESALWARQGGMGAAGIAVGSDVSALHDNPAALALLRRVEMAGNINAASTTTELTAFGTPASGTSRSTAINALAVAYPFPVYRGSLVIAGAYERPVGFNKLTVRMDRRPDPAGDILDVVRRDESGGLHQVRVGAAVDVAREVAIGASLLLAYARDTQSLFATATRADNPAGTETTEETFRTRALGIGGSVGTLVRISPSARAGATITVPRKLRFTGTGLDRHGSFTLEPQTFTLPMTLAGGLAVTPRNIILAADIAYTDWSQLTYDAAPCTGRVYYHLADGYKASTEIRVGAEVWVPHTLLRVRGGWQSAPLAVAFLGDPTSDANGYAPVEMVKDRHAWSAGLGYLIQGAYTIDLAYIAENYTRRTTQEARPWSGGSALVEATQQHQIVASVAFRI